MIGIDEDIIKALKDGRKVYFSTKNGELIEITDDLGLLEVFLKTGCTAKEFLLGKWIVE